VVVDNLGLEFTEGDDHSDCSAFSATGGGIFYDDSDNKFKKCMNNALTDLDTDTGGAPALSAVTAPTAVWSIAFDDGETVTWAGANDNESFVTIQLSDGTLTGATTALEITATDNDDTNFIPIAIYDDDGTDNDQIFKIDSTGSLHLGENPADDSGAIRLGNAAVIAWEDGTEATLTHVDDTSLALSLALDIVGAGGLILSNDDTITNAVDDTFLFSRDDSGTVTITAADDDANAALTVVAGGTGKLTLGNATNTDISIVTDGVNISETELTYLDGVSSDIQTQITAAGTKENITTVDTGEEAATFYPVLVDGATGDQATETDDELSYNPSTDTLTTVNFDVLGAAFPTDPGADKVLMWDDSATGSELVWTDSAANTAWDDLTAPDANESLDHTAYYTEWDFGDTDHDMSADL